LLAGAHAGDSALILFTRLRESQVMQLLRSRWSLVAVAVLVVGAVVVFSVTRAGAGDEAGLIAKATVGQFKVVVTTAGELRASSFVQITVPPNSDRAGAYQMKISKIVPEGTIVAEGDFVAELDRAPLANQLNNVNLSLTKATAVFEQAQLDTILNLSKAREDLRTMELAVEEKRIAKEQAVYEAPSIRRQAEIDFEKAERALAQAKTDLVTRQEQAQAKMREVGADLERWRIQQSMVQEVMAGFTIKAPAPGMVIYVKEWSGKKKAVGSQVSAWEPAVATLPDLTKMESVTFVNEIDVRKIAVGQAVSLSLDSDPDKKLTGKVVSVANVGEERPNSDAKVFEVKIQVAESDTTLRPGMTTANAIETLVLEKVLSIPLEAVTSEDNVPYVFRKSGTGVSKQEVATGALNDTHVLITAGLEEGDEVLLVPPANSGTMAGTRLPGSTSGPAKGGDAPVSVPVPVKPGGSR
jgi:RND family efflux transporter MFP subunit